MNGKQHYERAEELLTFAEFPKRWIHVGELAESSLAGQPSAMAGHPDTLTVDDHAQFVPDANAWPLPRARVDDVEPIANVLAAAQVHSMLALAAATVGLWSPLDDTMITEVQRRVAADDGRRYTLAEAAAELGVDVHEATTP